jgi:polyphosphate kinase
MPRNLVRRVELMAGIEDDNLSEKILQILQLQLNDNVLSHTLDATGEYTKVKSTSSATINNHKLLESHVNKMHKSVQKDTPNYIQQLAHRLFKES